MSRRRACVRALRTTLAESAATASAGAAAALTDFLCGPLDGYGEGRNRPDYVSTSRLSPHLRFGEIGPRQVWSAARHGVESGAISASDTDVDKFLSEIGWREFNHSILFHWPHMPTGNFKPEFDRFPWVKNESALDAWRTGQTGYPIVDAGMRQRIKAMRKLLVEKLQAAGVKGDLGYITAQRGMFSYTGLTAEQVDRLREEHAVYLVRSGRMCVAGLRTANVERTAAAMAAVHQAPVALADVGLASP